MIGLDIDLLLVEIELDDKLPWFGFKGQEGRWENLIGY
jgi:hypothetical protein